MEEKNGLPSSITQRKVMNVNFFVFSAIFAGPRFSATVATRRHDFSPLLEAFSPGRILAYCWALISRQLLEEGVPEVSPLGHFTFGFHFYQKPILTSPPAELIFRYRGHGEASINDIAWSRWLCFNPCRKNFCWFVISYPDLVLTKPKAEISP